MAEGLVKFFIQRLNSLLLQERQIFTGLEEQVLCLKKKLEKAGRVFEEVEKKTEKNDEYVGSYVRILRDIVHSVDDCINQFIIQMGKENGSDRTILVADFRSELEKIEAKLDEMVNKIMTEGEELSSAFFKFSYSNLPYYLQSCLMYCCIFPEDYQIPKGRLVRLLVAEGLVQEKPGEMMEDIAEENIQKLVELGMIHVVEWTHYTRTRFEIPSQYRKLLLHILEEEDFVIACTSSGTNVPHNTRRISIKSDTNNIPGNLNNLPIQALFVFGIERFSETEFDSLRPVFHGVKFLRVLDLQDIQLKNIPDEVGDLVHLRYLGLKKTNVDELPETVSNLRNLQTLDIRWNGKVKKLSSGILSLVKIRHLRMFKNWDVGGVIVPAGIGRLESLHTLTGIYAGGGIAVELGSLTQLRGLGVMDLAEDHSNDLYVSIMKMEGLLSLSLTVKEFVRGRKTLPSLEALSPPPLLQKLRIEGPIETIPSWYTLLENLTKLRLGFSKLTENPGTVLQVLPNLKHLSLWETYDVKQMGKEFCGVGGFPKLEVLVIASLVLEEWTELELGALPSLEYLHIHNSLRLRMLPEGLQHVATLQELQIIPLLDEYEQRLKPGGEENYKVQHIPHVSYFLTSVVQGIANSAS